MSEVFSYSEPRAAEAETAAVAVVPQAEIPPPEAQQEPAVPEPVVHKALSADEPVLEHPPMPNPRLLAAAKALPAMPS